MKMSICPDDDFIIFWTYFNKKKKFNKKQNNFRS